MASQAPASKEIAPEEEDENEVSEISGEEWERKLIHAWRELEREMRSEEQNGEYDEEWSEVRYPEEM